KQDYEEVVSQLKDKIDSTNFNDLKGKVGVVEKEIVDLNEEVSTKITSIDFDDAVGVNKWIVSKYPVEGTDFNQTPPSFSLISGVGASEIVDINDSVNMIAFSEGENFVSHYFTNVKMKSQKTISMNVEYDDSLSIYLNGASIYSYKYNDAQQVKVSISLRAGWNTIEMLHGQATGNPVLKVDTPLSTQVDKMTTVIGVGDKDETRLIK
ncbi:hypothetical protein, partial [Bacillus pumilus]|uniref:hypothetical protein n=1 Tax=Bacillus pumilus TaxID=1408 RepID=UPI0016431E5A